MSENSKLFAGVNIASKEVTDSMIKLGADMTATAQTTLQVHLILLIKDTTTFGRNISQL